MAVAFDLAAVNWLAVVAVFVLSMALGYLWYAPFLFGPLWMKGIGKTMEELKGIQKSAMLWMVFGAILMSVALGLIMPMAEATDLMSGLTLGLVIGVGLILPVTISNHVFIGHKPEAWMVTAGYNVVMYALAGLILGAWQ
jgi:hypothetical protein